MQHQEIMSEEYAFIVKLEQLHIQGLSIHSSVPLEFQK